MTFCSVISAKMIVKKRILLIGLGPINRIHILRMKCFSFFVFK